MHVVYLVEHAKSVAAVVVCKRQISHRMYVCMYVSMYVYACLVITFSLSSEMISWDLAPWKETLTVLGSCSSTPADTSAALRALWWPPRASMEFPAATARMSCKSAVRSATEQALLGPLKRTRCDWKERSRV